MAEIPFYCRKEDVEGVAEGAFLPSDVRVYTRDPNIALRNLEACVGRFVLIPVEAEGADEIQVTQRELEAEFVLLKETFTNTASFLLPDGTEHHVPKPETAFFRQSISADLKREWYNFYVTRYFKDADASYIVFEHALTEGMVPYARRLVFRPEYQQIWLGDFGPLFLDLEARLIEMDAWTAYSLKDSPVLPPRTPFQFL